MPEYIDRGTAIAKLTALEVIEPNATMADARRLLADMPAADVAPVAHRRIVGSLEDGRYRRRFSCCGEDATMITQWVWPKYCPSCGAKMDGGADNA